MFRPRVHPPLRRVDEAVRRDRRPQNAVFRHGFPGQLFQKVQKRLKTVRNRVFLMGQHLRIFGDNPGFHTAPAEVKADIAAHLHHPFYPLRRSEILPPVYIKLLFRSFICIIMKI